MSKTKEAFEAKFDSILQIILISDDDKRVRAIERDLIETGSLTYYDPIWKRHFKYADMFRKDKRPVDPQTGQYFGEIYY